MSTLIVGSMSVYNSVLVAFSVIVKTDYETDGSSAALVTSLRLAPAQSWAPAPVLARAVVVRR